MVLLQLYIIHLYDTNKGFCTITYVFLQLKQYFTTICQILSVSNRFDLSYLYIHIK